LTTIWTIGHSNHELPAFLGLLTAAGIEVVADVRTQPYSRFRPHFNRPALQEALRSVGLRYVFLGELLGGRPVPEDLGPGLERLLAGAAKYRVAMMCSEEDPAKCHRGLAITPALEAGGVAVVHVRARQLG
jgi:uncharacterized protein (DUF488 family)